MWWIVWAGCTDPKTADPTGSTTPTDPETTTPSTSTTDTETTPPTGTPTGDTGGASSTVTDPQPTSITATCDPTANALRFVCHVTVDPPQPVQVAFARADGSGLERVHSDLAATADHDVGLYFLAQGADYAFTASAVAWPDAPVATGTLTTGLVPSSLAATLDVTGTSSTPYVGANLPCGSGASAAVWDTETGEMLWYEVADPSGTFGGYEMLTFTEDHTILGQSGGQVMEIDLMGDDVLRRYEGVDYAEDLHHDLYKHDGLIYLLYHEGADNLDGFQVWDATGTELARWWAPDWLEIPAERDWMHTNTIYVDGGYVYLSLFQQNTVLKIDGDLASPTFGEPQWILGGSFPAGLGNDFTLDWSAVGGVDGFAHPHDVHLLPDGRLILLDNQDGRGLVLTVDETLMTATADEAYDTTAFTCGPQGTAAQTAAGDYLVDCSGTTIQEYAPGGTAPVWYADVVCAEGGGGWGGATQGAERWYALDGW